MNSRGTSKYALKRQYLVRHGVWGFEVWPKPWSPNAEQGIRAPWWIRQQSLAQFDKPKTHQAFHRADPPVPVRPPRGPWRN